MNSDPKCWVFALLKDRLCDQLVRVPGYRSRGSRFDSQRYHIFWEVVGLERGPLSLLSINEKLFEWKRSSFGSRKSRLTAMGIRCADYTTFYAQKFVRTSLTSGGRSIGIVCLRTKVAKLRWENVIKYFENITQWKHSSTCKCGLLHSCT
jgi:hypothetical protein